jgi:hypothetical protein
MYGEQRCLLQLTIVHNFVCYHETFFYFGVQFVVFLSVSTVDQFEVSLLCNILHELPEYGVIHQLKVIFLKLIHQLEVIFLKLISRMSTLVRVEVDVWLHPGLLLIL